jgi:hypothetical protein
MKNVLVKIFALAIIAVSNFAYADADDKKWIAQCIKDNKDEGAKPDVVKKYCTCMNDKMGDNETQSISKWEKTHQTEMKQCEKESGWK